jgi:hypothetical protein
VTATDAAATRALAEASSWVRREILVREGRLTVVLIGTPSSGMR